MTFGLVLIYEQKKMNSRGSNSCFFKVIIFRTVTFQSMLQNPERFGFKGEAQEGDSS